jgi:hypothetical protein
MHYVLTSLAKESVIVAFYGGQQIIIAAGVEDATAITVTSSKKEGKTEKAFH